MRSWIWLVVAVVGMALMVAAYERGMRLDPSAPWGSGLMVVGDGEPDGPSPIGEALATRLRYLPAGGEVDKVIRGLAATDDAMATRLGARLRPKVLEMPAEAMGPLATWLLEGRMPEPGHDELLAGWQARLDESITLAGRPAKVVGTLKPDVALLAETYLAPAHATLAAAFPKGDPASVAVRLLRVSAQDLRESKSAEALARAFPAKTFAILTPMVRPAETDHFAYLGGQALFLLGGSGLLIGLYRRLAAGISGPILGGPLQELAMRPRLLWGVHIVYFGLYLAAAAIVAKMPLAHIVSMSMVQGQFGADKKGVLAFAGQAYSTGSIAWAAVVTFVINFFLGSFAMISLPSMIIPGSGALLAAFRAGLWGVLLGPGDVALAGAMIPHTGTLLLEGGGYILATFFAILVPVYLLGRNESKPAAPPVDEAALAGEAPPAAPDTVGRRFLRAIYLNVAGCFWVAVVLAVAAVYEAAEVIHMAGF
jgi:hypothetical protein